MQAEHPFSRWLLFLYLFLHNYNRGDTMTEQKSDDLRMGALYIRVSTHEQDELSPDAQKRLLLDYAKSNGIQVWGIFEINR